MAGVWDTKITAVATALTTDTATTEIRKSEKERRSRGRAPRVAFRQTGGDFNPDPVDCRKDRRGAFIFGGEAPCWGDGGDAAEAREATENLMFKVAIALIDNGCTVLDWDPQSNLDAQTASGRAYVLRFEFAGYPTRDIELVGPDTVVIDQVDFTGDMVLERDTETMVSGSQT